MLICDILELGLAGSQKVSFSGKSDDEPGRVKKRRFLSQIAKDTMSLSGKVMMSRVRLKKRGSCPRAKF